MVGGNLSKIFLTSIVHIQVNKFFFFTFLIYSICRSYMNIIVVVSSKEVVNINKYYPSGRIVVLTSK